MRTSAYLSKVPFITITILKALSTSDGGGISSIGSTSLSKIPQAEKI